MCCYVEKQDVMAENLMILITQNYVLGDNCETINILTMVKTTPKVFNKIKCLIAANA